MSIKKQFLKNKPFCKVTFKIDKNEIANANTVNLVGDFNNWDASATPMKKLKNGSFSLALEFELGKEYQFRYLINGNVWHNDSDADRYGPTGYQDAENSVIDLTDV